MPLAKELRRALLLYVALGLLFAVALTHRARDTIDRFAEVVHGDELPRLPFDLDFPSSTLSQLGPEAVEAGLRPGERLVAMDGTAVPGPAEFFERLVAARPRDTLALAVFGVPAGEPRTTDLTIRPVREGAPSAYDWIRFAVGHVALPYLCLALGFWVAAMRIRDPRAWLVLLVLLGLAEFIGGYWRTLFGRTDWFQPVATVYQPLFGNLWPVSMMLFGIYFPERLPFDRRFPWVKWLVLAPVLFRVLGTNVLTDILCSAIRRPRRPSRDRSRRCCRSSARSTSSPSAPSSPPAGTGRSGNGSPTPPADAAPCRRRSRADADLRLRSAHARRHHPVRGLTQRRERCRDRHRVAA